jgi:hypothetical protein
MTTVRPQNLRVSRRRGFGRLSAGKCGQERPVSVFWGTSADRSPDLGARRAWSTFGGRAKSVPSESAQLCKKSHSFSFSIQSHASGRRLEPSSIKRRTASLRVMPALSA